MRPLRLTTLGLALVTLLSLRAPAEQKPQLPVFSSGTGLVLVDFVVMDKSDRLAGGLSAQDFAVKEDGKERPIVSFAAFGKGEVLGAGPAKVPIEPSAEAVLPQGSVRATAVVLFVDDGQLGPQEAVRLRPALKKLIDVMGERKGVLALVAPWSGVQIADEVQGNAAVFAAEIDKLVGHRLDERSPYPVSDIEAIEAEKGDPTVIERVARRFVNLNKGLYLDMALVTARGRVTEVAEAARKRRGDAFAVLLKALDWLAAKPGRHSVVMVSGGYASDHEDLKQQEVVTRSLQANAPIHFLDARSLQGARRYLGVEYRQSLDYNAIEAPLAFSDAAGGASGLADDTGGLYVRSANDMVKGLTRIMDMAATYYILGYEPPEHKKGGFRKIKVEVVTKGLKVLSRRGYFDEALTAR